MGYRHFTVIHKYAFKKGYVGQVIGETIEVHTIREGLGTHQGPLQKDAWDQAYIVRGSPCGGHWRSTVGFFELVREVHNLNDPANYL